MFHLIYTVITSVFRDRPLLKKMRETAMYLTVYSGLKGPAKNRTV